MVQFNESHRSSSSRESLVNDDGPIVDYDPNYGEDDEEASREAQQQDYFPEHYARTEDSKKMSFKNFLIFHPAMRTLYVLLLCAFLSFGLPLILDATIFDSNSNSTGVMAGTCHIREGLRSNCFPESEDFTRQDCLDKGCCYQILDLQIGAPLCHHTIPSVHSLQVPGQDSDDSRFTAPVEVFSFEGQSYRWPLGKYNETAVKVQWLSNDHVGILFYHPDDEPDLGWGDDDFDQADSKLDVTMGNDSEEDDRIQIRVTRRLTGEVLVDTSYGSHILGSQLSEITTLLPTDYLYGLGGHEFAFLGSKEYTNKTLYATDSRVQADQHEHSFPTVLGRDQFKLFYGLELETETPLTIEALPGLLTVPRNFSQPVEQPLMVYRTMGGYIALHVFAGPTAKEVLRQQNTKSDPSMSPGWSVPSKSALGYHICRRTDNPYAFIEHMKQMHQADLPVDSDCVDEALLTSAFETNPDLDLYLTNFTHYHVDLAVSVPVQVSKESPTYAEGPFVKLSNGSNLPVTGLYHDSSVSLPDFEAPSVTSWWKNGVGRALDRIENALGVRGSVAGVSLVHNAAYFDQLEVPEDCDFAQVGYVPHEVTRSLGRRSLCPGSLHEDGRRHLEKHNDYAAQSTRVTLDALSDRAAVFMSKHGSRQSRASADVLFGTAMQPSWDNMRLSLKEVLNMGLSGAPVVSMTACGVQFSAVLNTTLILDDLCLRWYQMAAYMPALNSFYGTEEQTRMPYDLSGAYRDWIQRALRHRLRLIPYFYTQLGQGIGEGVPLVRPLFLEFPDDEETYTITDQFMSGDSILVNPILDPGVTTLSIYFPYGAWFDLWSGQKVEGTGKRKVMDDIPYQISAYLRAGKVIPIMERSSVSIDATYTLSQHSLIVALSCDISPRGPLDRCIAEGHLYLDSTTTVDFAVISDKTTGSTQPKGGQLAITDVSDSSSCHNKEKSLADRNIGTVVVYGLDQQPSSVTLGDGTVVDNISSDYHDPVLYDPDTGRLQVRDSKLNWCEGGFRLVWLF